ncbi:hypothetical protein [Rhodanobacter sp. MP7CTX1]|uniref:hypothetical protein n=1 Tax=Rhodanobacter sp. MP7CTX1 TaxID=2723084 RepID=UPI0016091DD9|nr:hypothetical protein [Rhodanobacter sp. MP7CTX1]MBB6185869.1 hypothetical protein [Rhodanobacter sp. MP7CTX1]
MNTVTFLALIFAILTATAPRIEAIEANKTTPNPATNPTPSCTSPAHRQFDFFAGNWDTYDLNAPSKLIARNHVTITLNGCVIHENYQQNDGLHGESFSIYDATRDTWHQTWVTNNGKLLQLDGRLVGNRMILTASDRAADGTSSLLRGIWQPDGSTVRETAQRSTDGGKTWTPVFDIVFRPHPQDSK